MSYQKQKEVLEALDRLLNNVSKIPIHALDITPTYMDNDFVKSVLQLYGVQYIGRNGNGYEYEAVIFEEYKYNTSEVIFIKNVLTEDIMYEEAPIKQFSDTCVHFILSQYCDPSIYEFSIDDLWL